VSGNLLYINNEFRSEVSSDFVKMLPFSLFSVYFVSGALSGLKTITVSPGIFGPYVQIPNPLLRFSTKQPPIGQIVHQNADLAQVPGIDNVFYLRSTSTSCVDLSGNLLFAKDSKGVWYRFSPRLELVENTIEKPFSKSRVYSNPSWNPNVPKNFLNEESCIPTIAQGSSQFVSTNFRFTDTIIRKFYELSGIYAYYVTGLTPRWKPCEALKTRFMREEKLCSSPINSADSGAQLLRSLIQKADTSAKPIVVDVFTNQDSSCLAYNAGIQIQIGTTCWTHVHNDLYSVFDFTSFAGVHPGGAYNIQKFAQTGKSELIYPVSHRGTFRWDDNRANLAYLGIFGSESDFLLLPSQVQRIEIARYLNASSNGFVRYDDLCGSRGEVANDPSKGDRFGFPADIVLDSSIPLSTVWTNMALYANDQLRQRVAWALAQIFVVYLDSNAINSIELWANFYDIFVHNAFGNYFNVMKEVTYSPLMATMLTYIGRRAYQTSLLSADQNYARELMQLFSIGLWKLNKNGTKILNQQGKVLETYTNVDCSSMDWF
jgi:hypothetical protein